MKKMIRMANVNGSHTLVIPTDSLDGMMHFINEMANARPDIKTEIEVFSVGKMPFEKLPKEIQAEVKNTLKAYNRCSVVYEDGKYRESVGVCIKSKYSFDHFVCGDYLASEIYTPEERRQNYIEVFG